MICYKNCIWRGSKAGEDCDILINPPVCEFFKSTENNSIPVELPVILPKPNQPIFTIREVERMLADQRLSCMKQRYYYRYKGVKKMEEAILNAPPPQEFIDKVIVKIP